MRPGKSQRDRGGGNVIEIAESWRGGDDGFRHLLDLRGVPVVVVANADVTLDGIIQLADMPGLMVLNVYGVELDARQLDKLRADMPQVHINYKRGALLGVEGNEAANVAQITVVKPGTAAAKADLHPKDIVRKVNDKPIANFRELTDVVAQFRAGDEATIEIDRDGKTLTKNVTFGGW